MTEKVEFYQGKKLRKTNSKLRFCDKKKFQSQKLAKNRQKKKNQKNQKEMGKI